MSTNIIFTNFNNKPVTEQQLDGLDGYLKHSYEGNQLKKTEFYAYHKTYGKIIQKGGEYFLSSDENLSTIISQCLAQAGNWTFYYDKEDNFQQDTMWAFQTFYRGILKEQGKRTFDVEKKLIADCLLRPLTNTYGAKRKYFYGDETTFPKSVDGVAALTFYYYDDNSPREVYCNYGIEMDNDYLIEDFLARTSIMEIFPWDQNLYYHSFEPMLP